AVMSWSSVEATIQVVAGPRTRAVVWFASKFSGMRLKLHHCSGSSQYSSGVGIWGSNHENHASVVGIIIYLSVSRHDFQLYTCIYIIERFSRVGTMIGLFNRNHRRKPSLVIDDRRWIISPLGYQVHS